MTAIILHNFTRYVSGRKALGLLCAGLLLVTFIFSSYHQAEHDFLSNHMHCQVCWQFAADLNKLEKTELQHPLQIASYAQLCLQRPAYSSADTRAVTCRGPPNII